MTRRPPRARTLCGAAADGSTASVEVLLATTITAELPEPQVVDRRSLTITLAFNDQGPDAADLERVARSRGGSVETYVATAVMERLVRDLHDGAGEGSEPPRFTADDFLP